MRVRRTVLLALAVVALLLAGGVAAYLVPRRHALRCLLAFTEEVPAEGTAPEGVERVRDEARLGVADAWVARPDGDGPHPLMVFIAGIAPNGIGDARIVRGVEAFRRGGFAVVAPLIPGLMDPGARDMGEGSLERLLAALERGAVADTDPDRMGVVAISVGAPYAMRVLARHASSTGRRARAFLALGAPADFDRCARGWFEMAPLGKEKPETQDDELRLAAELARNMLWRTAAARIVGHDEDATRLNEWLKEEWVPEKAPEGLASDAGRAYAAMVLGPPAGWRARRDEVLAAADHWTAWLSPVRFVDELDPLRGMPVFLLHGDTDPLVLASEMEPLAALLRPGRPVHTLRSHMVTHVNVGDVGIGERLAHLDFMHDFFEAVREGDN